MNINYVIKDLMDASDNGTLAIFVGAGVSRCANVPAGSKGMPSWGELVEALRNEAGIKEDDYLKAAQMYYNYVIKEEGKNGIDEKQAYLDYLDKIKQFFPAVAEPGKTHELLLASQPHNIVTTNWDTLLEDAARKYGYVYDTVASDKDLGASRQDRKIIKMHGDFKSKNIVFKEDDYLGYRDNYPLIESYVRSLIFTHTMLFIGYSYNDVNIKEICYWIRERAETAPKAYITLFSLNDNVEAYMRGNRFIPIKIDDPKDANPLFTLDVLLGRIPSANAGSVVQLYNGNPLGYLVRKLTPLLRLDALLFSHVTSALTNCSVVSIDVVDGKTLSVLSFYSMLVSGDYNKAVRDMYAKLLSCIKTNDISDEEVKLVFDVLRKAGIDGISVKSDAETARDNSYFVVPKDDNAVYDKFFRSVLALHYDELTSYRGQKLAVPDEMIEAYVHFQREEYEEALKYTDRAISILAGDKNFTLLLAAWYNHNVVLWAIQFAWGAKGEGRYNGERIDIRGRYEYWPVSVRHDNKGMFDFVAGDTLSGIYSVMRIAEAKKEKSVKTVKNGGFVFDGDRASYVAQFQNIVHFAVNNCLFTDMDGEYTRTAKSALNIYLARFVQKPAVDMDMFYAYVCIRLLDADDLRRLLLESCKDDSGKAKPIVMSDADAEFLVHEVFLRMADVFKDEGPSSRYETYMANVYLILGLLRLTDGLLDEVVSKTAELVAEKHCTMQFIQAVDEFFPLQYNVNGKQFDSEKVLPIIKTMMNKLVQGRLNGYEAHAMEYDGLVNIFTCGYVGGGKFDDVALLEQTISALHQFEVRKKMHFASSFIVRLRDISNDECSKKIDAFLLAVLKEAKGATPQPFEQQIFEIDLLTYYLVLAERDLVTVGDAQIADIQKWLEGVLSGGGYSSNMQGLVALVDYFIKNKKDTRFEPLKAMLDKIFSLDRAKCFSVL